MKTYFFQQILSKILLLGFILTTIQLSAKASNDDDNTISISGAFALYPITVKWAEEFKKMHPSVKFEVSAGGAGKGISDVLAGLVDLAAFSRDVYPEEYKKGAYPIAVTRDAVLPTINANNPNLPALRQKGLKRSQFIKLYKNGLYQDWKQLGFPIAVPIHLYTRSDAAGAAETWAKYLGAKQEDLQGVGIYGDPGQLQAIARDKVGVGFNNIAYAYNIKTDKLTHGIAIIPIDVNENGKIDPSENFYGSLTELKDAIDEGRYPAPPARNLTYISKQKPKKKVVIQFLEWVLSEGQQYVDDNGYIALSKKSLEVERKKVK